MLVIEFSTATLTKKKTATLKEPKGIANLTLRLQRCIDIAITTSMICCDLTLLSNVDATLVY